MENKHHTRCSRCDGLMVNQCFFDRIMYFNGWKCCNCGDIVDEVISNNRSMKAFSINNNFPQPLSMPAGA